MRPLRPSPLGCSAQAASRGSLQRYRRNPETRPSLRRQLRIWNDPYGRDWNLVLREEPRFAPGKLLIFTGDPKDGLGSPKVLVRGVRDVYSVPDPALPFYLDAAQCGGFVWRDRDGTPWHIRNRTHIASETGRSLEVHHVRSHQSLWELSDLELEALVRQSIC